MSAVDNTTRDRIKQVILHFNWGNYRLDELEKFKHDEGAQAWAEHLANAIQVHLNGDLNAIRAELDQVADLAERARAAGERIHPGHILDITGWPITSPRSCNCESYEPCSGECCGPGNCTCSTQEAP